MDGLEGIMLREESWEKDKHRMTLTYVWNLNNKTAGEHNREEAVDVKIQKKPVVPVGRGAGRER